MQVYGCLNEAACNASSLIKQLHTALGLRNLNQGVYNIQ